ncbi:MAG: hypothetical protein IKK34_12880 [Clostridia bacterium]|nr:hypothetical protein [Clostridia bacterium]MBR3796903.1 hypothetical protein [Clostridia bacterium]
MAAQGTSAIKKRKPLTPEQRRRNAERQREAKRREPERFKRYRDKYIMRRAARLIAEAEDAERGDLK